MTVSQHRDDSAEATQSIGTQRPQDASVGCRRRPAGRLHRRARPAPEPAGALVGDPRRRRRLRGRGRGPPPARADALGRGGQDRRRHLPGTLHDYGRARRSRRDQPRRERRARRHAPGRPGGSLRRAARGRPQRRGHRRALRRESGNRREAAAAGRRPPRPCCKPTGTRSSTWRP